MCRYLKLKVLGLIVLSETGTDSLILFRPIHQTDKGNGANGTFDTILLSSPLKVIVCWWRDWPYTLLLKPIWNDSNLPVFGHFLSGCLSEIECFTFLLLMLYHHLKAFRLKHFWAWFIVRWLFPFLKKGVIASHDPIKIFAHSSSFEYKILQTEFLPQSIHILLEVKNKFF